MRHLKFKLVLASCVLVIASLGLYSAQAAISLAQGSASLAQATQASTPAQVCKFAFEATVREGSSKGTSYAGDMTLNIDTAGGITGDLTASDGTKVPVFGQVTGRAINLLLELKPMAANTPGSYVYGTGTALEPIMANSDCGGTLGGTFTGPNDDDLGTWIDAQVCVTYNGTQHCVRLVTT